MGWFRELFDRRPQRGSRHAPPPAGAVPSAGSSSGSGSVPVPPAAAVPSAASPPAVAPPAAASPPVDQGKVVDQGEAAAESGHFAHRDGDFSLINGAEAPPADAVRSVASAAVPQADLPGSRVTLGFSDGTEAALAALDPRTRAFVAVADTLHPSR